MPSSANFVACDDPAIVGILRHAQRPAEQLAQEAAAEATREQATTEPMTLRRWEAAETHRLNKAHWANAHGNSINADLYLDLEQLRARCTYEIHNNPMMAGVVETYVTDMVGDDGPQLQVLSDDEGYNNALEDLWTRAFWPQVTADGKLAGVDWLKMCLGLFWSAGENFDQIVTARGREVPIAINAVHPRRLATPFELTGKRDVTLGIEHDQYGTPRRYYIVKYEQFGAFEYRTDQFQPLPPDDVMHTFRALEPGQMRGVPWAACALPVIADLRDYDQQVMDAARQAAAQSLWFYTDHPEAPFMLVNESTTLSRGEARTAPPGWKPHSLPSTQPHAQYLDFRRERMRELGRPVGMPLMTILLDSAKHNYSSARFDGQIYSRILSSHQRWLERDKLNRLCHVVSRDAELAGRIPPRPRKVSLAWTWPTRPHVDPQKEQNGDRMGLENGLPWEHYLQKHGITLDKAIGMYKRLAARLEAEGLPVPPFGPVSLQAIVSATQPMPEEPVSQQQAEELAAQ